jgi:hypothetical protein
MTFSDDAGSTYAATAYYSGALGLESDGSTNNLAASNLTTGIKLLGGGGAGESMSNTADETGHIDIVISSANTGTSKMPAFVFSGGFINGTGNGNAMNGYGTRKVAADYDAVKLVWEGGGNFAAVGSYVLYKLA